MTASRPVWWASLGDTAAKPAHTHSMKWSGLDDTGMITPTGLWGEECAARVVALVQPMPDICIAQFEYAWDLHVRLG